MPSSGYGRAKKRNIRFIINGFLRFYRALCVKVIKKTPIFGVGVGLFISLSGGLLFREKHRRTGFLMG